MRSFASLESGSVASAAGGDGRNEPKISLPELVTLVRHSKYSKVKEALDYIPTKKFDPSVIEVNDYIPNHIYIVLTLPAIRLNTLLIMVLCT